jgi:hypothetical protein
LTKGLDLLSRRRLNSTKEKQEDLMTVRKDWPKLLAFVIFFMLLGGYYDRLTVETRTFILPLLIFIAAALIFGRLMQLQHEVRSSRVTALEIVTQQLSLADTAGNERLSMVASSDRTVMTFYDNNQVSRLVLELIDREPVLKLVGEKGSAKVAINYDGAGNFSILNDQDEVIWTAP